MRSFKIVLALLLVALAAMASNAYGSNWPMFQHNAQNTGFNSDERGIDPPLELKWIKWPKQTVYERRTRPVVSGGVVYVGQSWGKYDRYKYVGEEGQLQAIPLSSGSPLWTAKGMRVSGSPALSNGLIYFGTKDGKFYALRAQDGSIVWQLDTLGIPTAPIVFGHFVYFGTSNGKIYALNAGTGEPVWVLDKPGSVFSMPAATIDTLFVGGPELLAVDLTTGRIKWSFNGGWGHSTPAVKDKSVFVSCGYRLYCLNTETGQVKWSYSIGNGSGDKVTPSISGNNLYWGTVTAFDADTGQVKWSFNAQNKYTAASVAIANGYVFVGSTRDAGTTISDTSDGRLYALKEDTGELVWQYLAGKRYNDWYFIDPSPAVSDRSVVLNLSTSQLCCFVSPERSPLQNLSVSSSKINPYDLENGKVDLTFNLSAPAKVTVDVQNYKGETVRCLVNSETFSLGPHQATWQGLVDFPEMADPGLRAQFGDKCILVAPDGDYRLVIRATVDSGQVYSISAGVEVEADI